MFTGVINTDNSEQVGGNISVLQQDGSGNLKVVTASSTDIQRVSAQSGDFATGSIVDLLTLLTLSGTPSDANTVNSFMGRFTKIRDLLAATLTVQGTITEANSAAILADTADIETNTGNIPPLGQALASASTPVVLPASQIGGTGLALENGGNLASSKNDLDTIAAAQVAQGSTTLGQNGPLMQAAVTSASPSYTNGQTSPITQTPSGGMRSAQSGTWTIQPGNTPNTVPWLESVNDGTNTANVLKSDMTAAGQNAMLQAPTYFSTGTLTLNAGSPNSNWYDLGNYPWISLEVLTNAAALTLTFQTSGDSGQTNVRSSVLFDSQNQTAAGSSTTTSAVASFSGPRTGRYFRISSNASGGNTATIVLTFYTSLSLPTSLGASIAGASSTGVGVPGTALFQGVSDGANLQGMRTPALFMTAVATASGNTAVWTPQTGKKFRLMAYSIELTANASQSVSGLLEVTLQDAASALNMGMSAFVPSVAATVFGNNVTTGWRLLGNGKLSAAANNVLNVNLGAALSTGEVRVNAIGTEE